MAERATGGLAGISAMLGLLLRGARGPASLRDAKLRHSGEGAAPAGRFPMRLCHLFPGFWRKEGHGRLWGWSREGGARAGEPREQQGHQRHHLATLKTSTLNKHQHSPSFPSEIPSLLGSPLTTTPATFSALLFTQARAFIHKTLK